MINVSELITDPDFAQPGGIKIIRTSYKIVDHELVESANELKVQGIITVEDVSTNQDAYGNVLVEKIKVFTHNPLYLTGKPGVDNMDEFLSDIVVFRGQNYSVEEVLHDERYGFSKATCTKLRQDVM